ncbi:hypothetical protein [Stenotrophomonas sp.]|uniref:hypothetical protein n=1 Tax=Stenotrophomonas sp. TaxID=69392 RepID=UPI0028A7AB4F|nr:hypothetical protein [Stenotrophomonas sp.]
MGIKAHISAEAFSGLASGMNCSEVGDLMVIACYRAAKTSKVTGVIDESGADKRAMLSDYKAKSPNVT